MTPDPGTRFGPYELTGQIGAGGMGEVYRATDTRLGREVAIKTLPAALASDRDRLARFEREAQLLAALDHPHIASIYSLDEHDGTRYLAMELVEGETLEAKLKPGALPVDDALRLALQIAQALEAAHDRGVIHRDLKPANIMVTPNGIVKVLDFGLAKAFSDDPAAANAAQSPALSVAMTQAGLILGTAGYMSPEQASGQATDQRADIWSFGVVLYEMLTGLPLFTGESAPHILADVLKTEPDWNRLPVNLHPRLKLLLERCLKKKARSRYHSIADARIDIEDVLSDPQGATVLTSPAPTAARVPAMLPRIAVTAVIALAIAGLAAWAAWPEADPPLVVRSVHALPEGRAFPNFGQNVVEIAPDGRHFVYSSLDGKFLRRMDTLDEQTISNTVQEGGAFGISPDGQSIAFARQRPPAGGLLDFVRLSVTGGAAVPLTSFDSLGDTAYPMSVSWEADGTILYSRLDEIWRVPENGGEPEVVIAAADGETAFGPQRLPGGDWVLFTLARGDTETRWDDAELVIQSLATGERRVLRGGATAGKYVPTGHIVYAFSDTLYAVPFDLERRELTGGPVPVVQGVRRDEAAASYDFSSNGTLVYAPGGVVPTSSDRLAIVDSRNSIDPWPMPGGTYADVRVSPDGRWAAFTQTFADGDDIAIYELGGNAAPRRLTFGGQSRFPVWSADSARVAFQSTREGAASIYWQLADGSGGAPERLTAAPDGEPHTPDSFSPTGQLAYTVVNGGESSIRVLDPVAGVDEPLISGAGIRLSHAAFSPDGQWIAYQSSELGGADIFVQPVPLTGAKFQVPQVDSTANHHPVWSADGSELYYFPGPARFESVRITTVPAFSFGSAVAHANNAMNGAPATHRQLDVMPDGSGFIGAVPGNAVATGAEAAIYIVQNWFEELNRLAPTD